MSKDFAFVFQLLWFVSVAVPTVLFYGWIAVFAGLAAREMRPGRRKPKAGLLAAIGLAPLVWYGTVYGADLVWQRQPAAIVRDAGRLPPPSNPPRVLVVHGARSGWQDDLVEMGAFDAVYVTLPVAAVRLENARRQGCDAGARGNIHTQNILRARMGFLVCATETKIARAPADGLHFYQVPPSTPSGRSEWLSYAELKLVDGGSEQRVGFHGVPIAYTPVVPPVLSTLGFFEHETPLPHIVPWYGEIPFLFGRLGLDSNRLNPLAQPSREDVRAEFLRLRDSSQRPDQVVASYIAAAVGASLLSADDVAPVLASDVVDQDFAREIGYQQFCRHFDRLCDFPDQLLAACKAKRAYAGAGAVSRCERLPRQCEWCRTIPQCRPTLDGELAACSPEQDMARAASLRALMRDE